MCSSDWSYLSPSILALGSPIKNYCIFPRYQLYPNTFSLWCTLLLVLLNLTVIKEEGTVIPFFRFIPFSPNLSLIFHKNGSLVQSSHAYLYMCLVSLLVTMPSVLSMIRQSTPESTSNFDLVSYIFSTESSSLLPYIRIYGHKL